MGADGKRLHYIRALVPIAGEGLVATGRRYGTNRHNPYFKPGAYRLKRGLESFTTSQLGHFQRMS